MTVNKKPTSISRHKTGTTRQAAAKAAPSPQAFDIIPRSQVKPSATSRPVITSSQPEVADNTLTQPSAAPQLQLRHRTVELKPSAEAQAAAAAEASAPTEQGVSVSDLLAKRAETDKPIATEPTQESPALTSQSADGAKSDAKDAAKDEKKNDTADKTGAEPVIPSEGKASDEETEAGAPASTKPDVDVDSKAKAATDVEPDAEDSVAQALKDDSTDGKPAEHSDALKEAMKDLDGNPDDRPHHELFGGKPVIVVHKDHHTSGLMWFVWFVICLLLAILIVNFLLDAEVISTTYDIPYSDVL